MNNTFEQTIRAHRGGGLADELSDSLAELVARVRLTGRKGELHLKITVKPATRGNAETLLVSDTVKLVTPKTDAPESVFFAGPENTLLRENPNQATLDLKTLPVTEHTPTTQLKKVN